MKQTRTKELTPIYLSIARLVRVIDLVSNRSLTKVPASFFEGYGFSRVDALLAVNALKFLGLINDTEETTDLMTKMRLRGDTRRKEFEKILRIAYKRLFDAADTPQDLPIDQLESEFVVQYGVSKRIFKSAVPVFLKLCEYAGLRDESPIRKTNKVSNKEKKMRNSGAPPRTLSELNDTAIRAGFAPIRVAEGRIVLNIPSELKDRLLDDESLNEDWHAIRAELRKFADKYIPDNSPKNEIPKSQ